MLSKVKRNIKRDISVLSISVNINGMLKYNFLRTSWCKLYARYMHKTTSLLEAKRECEITKIRNIGILAHIDAG